MTQSETPTLDRMLAWRPKLDAINDFIDWMDGEGVFFATYNNSLDCPVREIDLSRERLLAKYCDIDLNEADKEKVALLEKIREFNQKYA